MSNFAGNFLAFVANFLAFRKNFLVLQKTCPLEREPTLILYVRNKAPAKSRLLPDLNLVNGNSSRRTYVTN